MYLSWKLESDGLKWLETDFFSPTVGASELLLVPIVLFCFCFCGTALQEPVVHGDAGPPGDGATRLVEGVLFRQARSGRSASKTLTKPRTRRQSVRPSSCPQALAARDALCLGKIQAFFFVCESVNSVFLPKETWQCNWLLSLRGS